jgi:hypothetical protein
MAMGLIKKQKLPGYKFRYFLRTNLSSFWRFDVLLEFLSAKVNNKLPLYAGFKYTYNNYPVFAAGAGFCLNEKSYDMLLRGKKNLE